MRHSPFRGDWLPRLNDDAGEGSVPRPFFMLPLRLSFVISPLMQHCTMHELSFHALLNVRHLGALASWLRLGFAGIHCDRLRL